MFIEFPGEASCDDGLLVTSPTMLSLSLMYDGDKPYASLTIEALCNMYDDLYSEQSFFQLLEQSNLSTLLFSGDENA